jgi:phage terminase large subunit-like protein
MSHSPSLASADREAVKRGGLPAFVELALPHYPSVRRYVPARHLVVLAEQFEALYRGECRVLCCNLPPGVGKSLITTVGGPAWIWTEDPTYPMLVASYAQSLVTKLAEEQRGLMQTPWFRDRWGDILVEGSGVLRLMTYAGGYRYSTTVGGGATTGSHGGMFIIDDPINPDPRVLNSERGKVIENTQQWMSQKVLTRGAVGEILKVCLTMQRVHPDDSAGALLGSGLAQQEYFRHVCLPWEYEPERASKYDWRTREGELLWDEPGKVATFETLAHEHGKASSVWRAHVQQDPSGGSDRLFRAETFKDFTGAPDPRACMLVMSVDPTFTASPTADDVAIEIWGLHGGHFWCFYSEHEKRDFVGTLARVEALRAQWKPNHVLIEKAANGAAIMNVLAHVPGLEAIVPAGKSKRMRAASVAHYFATERVHFDTSAAWYSEKARLLARFTGAPGGKDDTVDTTTQAIAWLQERGGGRIRHDRRHEGLGSGDEAYGAHVVAPPPPRG